MKSYASKVHERLAVCLICFETSSMPDDNLEMATEMSSFADSNVAVAGLDLPWCCGEREPPAKTL
jgi:hypothetical protein